MFKNVNGPLSAVLKAAADAVVLIDDDGRIQQVSDSIEQVFGYQPHECVGANVSMLMPEPDRSAHDRYLASYRQGAPAKVIGIGRNTTGRKKNGAAFPIRLSIGEYKSEGRSWFVGICHDLTDYYNTLADLERAKTQYREIVESERYFICRLDEQLRLTFANSSLATVLGKSHDDLIGTHLTNLLSGESRQQTRELEELLSKDHRDEVYLQFNMLTAGSSRHADWSFRQVESGLSGTRELQGFGVDVSDRERALSRARFLKNHDQLTGLFYSRAMIRYLRKSLQPGQTWAFLLIDPDRFSQINQRYGYEFGDNVIVQMTQRMESALPVSALMARQGGDELMVAFPVPETSGAMQAANDILKPLEQPYPINGFSHTLECKAGVALFPDHSNELERMPELAEAAMREAKTRNISLVMFDGRRHKDLLRQISMEQLIKRALSEGTIDVYLQPKVTLATRKKCGYEALARWHHPEWGSISPADFIPVAEAAGMGPAMDRYILREVASILAGIRASLGSPEPIAVNITAHHFADPAFSTWLSGLIEEFGLTSSDLELEITEGVLLGMTETVSNTIAALRSMGIKISLDDFGTEYSSLSYLKNLDVDELKIDKSFINDIDNEQGILLVKSIIGLAKAYSLKVTAEGVESADQARRLTELGCDVAQGYFFSPAIPAEEATAWEG
ncbi:EAL domain-containing protein [Marinobacter sp. M-5]|uniref:sensor domain-containing protein n=1 Tax=Marinobacter sp. M-5 TaxID=3081089 RepID=UPI00293C754A|nr:EAL domain-containing protein [Marinobacter sp. M-5]MDV3504212.1 EAL domain-containing protein [Marinobacter sp. M-5]